MVTKRREGKRKRQIKHREENDKAQRRKANGVGLRNVGNFKSRKQLNNITSNKSRQKFKQTATSGMIRKRREGQQKLQSNNRAKNDEAQRQKPTEQATKLIVEKPTEQATKMLLKIDEN